MNYTEDLELQKEAHNFGEAYFKEFFDGMSDLEKKSLIINSAAAGYLNGKRSEQKAEDERRRKA